MRRVPLKVLEITLAAPQPPTPRFVYLNHNDRGHRALGAQASAQMIVLPAAIASRLAPGAGTGARAVSWRPGPRAPCGGRRGRRAGRRAAATAGAPSAESLAASKCSPCEEDGGSLGFMGLCEAMSASQAEPYLRAVRWH